MLSMHCKSVVISLCLTALYTQAAFAEPPQLETIIVTAARHERSWLTTPAAASVIDAESQVPGLHIDSGELLQGLPGLQVDSRSNYAQDTRLVLRGFGARSAFGIRGMDVRLDNIPLAMPDGQAQLGSVLLGEVASVEVLRGPLATLYGNGAGGVIRLETLVPTENTVRLATSVGSSDSRRQEVSASWRGGPWAARAQVSHLTGDGFRPHSAVERQQGGAQLYYEGDSGLEARLRVDASRDPETQDPSGLSPEAWRDDPEQVSERVLNFNTRKQLKHRQLSLSLNQDIATGSWQFAAWQGRRNVDQWLPFAGEDIDSSGAVIDLQRDFSGVQASYRHQASLAEQPLAVTLGASLERMEDRRRGYVNNLGDTGALRRDEVGTVDSDDIYTLVEWQPLDRVSILGGIRHSRSDFAVEDFFIVEGNPDDSGSLGFSETSAALGLNYQFAKRWAAFGSVGRGFETPTLTEMAYRNEGTGLNTALSPSTNVQLEAGLRYSDAEALQWALTAFSVDSDDELVVDQSINSRTTYHNAAATRRYGLEFEGEWRLAPAFSTRASASLLEAEYTRGEWDGNRLPGVARSQVYVQLRWLPWQNPRLALSLAGRYRSGVATSDNNHVEAPEYITFDLSITGRHRWGSVEWETWLTLENLTDKSYVGSVIVNQDSGRSFEPAPDRSVMVGVELAI